VLEGNELSRSPPLLSVQEEVFKKKICRLKQKLIMSFVNQAIKERTVSQEDELSSSLFAPSVQEEDDFSTETKTDSLFVSQVISAEMMREGNEM
jgi:hypothetical protein